ncbi:MAG TPA: Tad domain-containing protein [Actinomycetota bacterium]|nr:Tad domain-containing protein [Actinomycetota bacterium]
MNPIARLRREERGVTAVVVAVCLIAVFGAAVLTVDAGQLWAVRRNAITATDASALSVARNFAFNSVANPQCSSTSWQTVLTNNAGNTFNSSCSFINVTGDGGAGVVIVNTYKRSNAIFSGALGIGSSAAFAQSAAKWGFITQPTGLRPIALCLTASEVKDGLGNTTPPAAGQEQHTHALFPNNYNAPDGSTDYAISIGRGPTNATVGLVHHIAFTSDCNGGSASGNFGWIDLNNYGAQHSPPLNCQGACTNQNEGDLANWLMNGYYGNNVDITNSDCDTQAPGTQGCNGDTGKKNSSAINSAMQYLQNPSNPGGCTGGASSTCKPLPIPIILANNISGSGANGQFSLAGVVFVKIWDWNLSGNDNARFLDIQFVQGLFQGTCCAASPPSNGAPPAKGDQICATDHDPVAVTTRCALS